MNMEILTAVVLVILLCWLCWGVFSSRVEQARFTMMKKADGYEIRHYPAHLVAQTTVEGSYRQALNQGFRILAAYIFGDNTAQETIEMTAPVREQATDDPQGNVAVKIAMTAPVRASRGGQSHVVSFGMPQSYTRATLPKPTDPHVQIVQMPAQKMAVRGFSWFATEGRVREVERQLLAALARDKVISVGTPFYAGYNAPWTPPWLNRHEVLIEII